MLITVILLAVLSAVLSVVLAMDLEAQQQEIERLKKFIKAIQIDRECSNATQKMMKGE